MVRLFVPILLLLASCSSETNPLCECIQKSEALNYMSHELLFDDSTTAEEQDKLFALRKEIDSICEPFKMMGPEELYKMRNECLDDEMIEMMK